MQSLIRRGTEICAQREGRTEEKEEDPKAREPGLAALAASFDLRAPSTPAYGAQRSLGPDQAGTVRLPAPRRVGVLDRREDSAKELEREGEGDGRNWKARPGGGDRAHGPRRLMLSK